MTPASLTPGAVCRVRLPAGLGSDVGPDDYRIAFALVLGPAEELSVTVPGFYQAGGAISGRYSLVPIAVLASDGRPALVWVSAERIEGEAGSEPPAVERDAASLPRAEEPHPNVGPPVLASLGASSCERGHVGAGRGGSDSQGCSVTYGRRARAPTGVSKILAAQTPGENFPQEIGAKHDG